MSAKKSASKSLKSDTPNILKKNITHPKLIVFLLILLALPAFSFAYNKYKDWDNAQFIKGLAKDFPALVEEVATSVGLELEINKNCMTTTEKFGSGIATCEFLTTNPAEGKDLVSGFKILRESKVFPTYSIYANSEGINVKYRNKKSCQFRTKETIYMSCVIGVRDANLDLARELFR